MLDGLLRPQSIAIIGASNTPGKIGYLAAKNVIESDYEGAVYPINWNAEEILGVKAYASVLDVPGEIDAALIIVPAESTPAVVEECGRKGVKGLIIVASGYSEAGRKDLEDRVVAIAHRYGMRVLGPNIVGIMSNSDRCNASFAPFLPLPGKASMLSQSGALLIAMTVATYSRHVGFDKMIPTGNMADVNFSDLVAWLNADEATACITMYIEGLHDGRRFIETAKCAKKPIVALKAGISAHGAAAAASHTGSMAGSGQIYNAAFKQAGIVRAADLNNLFDRTLALSLQPPMRGDNLLVLSNGGGVGVLAADAAERYGVPLQFAPDDVQTSLKAHMPPFGSAKNPVDLTGMVGWREYEETVTYALSHPWVDGLVVLYCETQRTEPLKIAESIKRAVAAHSPPVGAERAPVPIVVSFIGGERSDEAMKWLAANGIPAYGAPDRAVNAMAALREYARACHSPDGGQAAAQAHFTDVDHAAARAILAEVRAVGRDPTEVEAKRVFASYGLPVVATELARSEAEAVAIAEAMGYPVVMKIISPAIVHKSDAGGVKINVRGVDEVRAAYREILENATAYAEEILRQTQDDEADCKAEIDIHGIAIQEMAPWGTEVILGSINDSTFGPTLMFGLGGVFVEVLRDVTFRVAPVSTAHAMKMLSEIAGAPILGGVRGEAPRDREALAEALSRYAQMITELGDEISESDANPVLVYAEGKGVKIVDARIVLTTPNDSGCG
jgi:acetyltransferase